MIPAGWVLMIISVGFVLGLVCFCFYRVLTAPAEEARPWRDGEMRPADREH